MNYSKLRGRIIEVFGSVAAFASAIGKTRQTVDNKLKDRRGLSQDDIIEWAEALNINPKDFGVYFFTLNVPKKKHKEVT